MNLKSLSNQELNSKLSTCLQKEREILSEILQLIVEVNSRKLYLDLAYPSLFEYLVKHHGYSAGSAYRRIEAARLMRDIPDLPEKLESGALNLSQVSLLQKSIKLSQNKKRVQISKEEKQTLLTSLENKSFTESQVLVSKILDISVQDQAKIQYQKNESVRIQMTLTKSQWQKVKHMQELLSNSFPNGNDLPKLLEYLADKVIRQKTVISKQGDEKLRQSISPFPFGKQFYSEINAANTKTRRRKPFAARDIFCRRTTSNPDGPVVVSPQKICKFCVRPTINIAIDRKAKCDSGNRNFPLLFVQPILRKLCAI